VKRPIGRPLERTLAERKSTSHLAKLLFLLLTSSFFNNMKAVILFQNGSFLYTAQSMLFTFRDYNRKVFLFDDRFWKEYCSKCGIKIKFAKKMHFTIVDTQF